MSFREKVGWATLAAMTLAFGWYFANIANALHTIDVQQGAGMWQSMHWFGLATVAFIVIMVLSTSIIAIAHPRDASARADERERLIGLRASRFAYVVLLIGVLLAFAAAHIGHGLYFVLNLLLLVMILAEGARIAFTLWLYRRGT